MVEDIDFTHNLVRHAPSAINILASDDRQPSRRAARIRIAGNLFDDIDGTLLQLIGGATDVVVQHNTAFHTGNVITAEGEPHARFVFEDNLVQHNQYGIIGTGQGPGLPTLRAYFPDAVVKGNVIVGGQQAAYPTGNFFPESLERVGFVPGSRGWPRLAATSAYRRAASDGADVGADLDALAALARVAARPDANAHEQGR